MTNHLAAETSLYLRQHAEQPVEWYPWGEAALARAKAEDKPILLSIGYSACHWCHVMAHESFDDPEVAAVMNELFINIKVDREERPDLDQIYQTAHAILTRRSGGWPLTVFLTPEQEPFFGGTYFPKTPRYGLLAFPDLLKRVAAAYRQNRAAIAAQGQNLADAMAPAVPAKTTGLEPAWIDSALGELASSFDPIDGGFGQAPKFPHPTELAFCLARHADSGSGEAREIVLQSLRKMADGGLYDQLGGGFCRYSVDGEWSIPHFEKMLYDNGLLLALYSDAYALGSEPRFAAIAEGIVGWLEREMTSPEGMFYASLDADSEHEEGKFYLWTPDTVKTELSDAEYAVFAPHFGLDLPANFEDHAWHLRVARPLADIAGRLGIDEAAAAQTLEQACRRLLAVREQRVRPGRDEKILTSWNALMITGLARAARGFNRPDWQQRAATAFDQIQRGAWAGDILHTSIQAGQPRHPAYLDDYALLAAAGLELLQNTWRQDWLAQVVQLADALLGRFEDSVNGGFYFTAHDHERLFQRPMSPHDNAVPAGNGVAVQLLIRLGHLLGEQRYLDAAERALHRFALAIRRHPSGSCSLLSGLAEWLTPPTTVVLLGPADETAGWEQQLTRHYAPHQILVDLGETTEAPPTLAKPVTDRPQAWICKGTACLAPINSVEEARAVLIGAALGDPTGSRAKAGRQAG